MQGAADIDNEVAAHDVSVGEVLNDAEILARDEACVREIEKKIAEFEDQIEGVEDTVKSIEKRVTDMVKGPIAAVIEKLSKVENDIIAIRNDMDELDKELDSKVAQQVTVPVHLGCTCHKCDMYPIVGLRFHFNTISDSEENNEKYDLCSTCEAIDTDIVPGITKIKIEGGDYIGGVQDGLPHGKGRLSYPSSGRIHTGSFVKGLPDGPGLTKYGVEQGGAEFIGMYKLNEKCGIAKYTWGGAHKGAIYLGEFAHDLQEGIGHYTYSSGTTFLGTWKENVIHGVAKLHYADTRDTYVGEMVMGDKEGEGTYVYGDGGLTYTGKWRDDEKNGIGKFIFSPYSWYTGEFHYAEPHGVGRFVYTGGNKYVGEWLEGVKHGYGRTTFSNSDSYVGKYSNDLKSGIGKFISSIGEKYIGTFLHGERVSNGLQIFELDPNGNGDTFSYYGNWKEDKRYGKGKYCTNRKSISLDSFTVRTLQKGHTKAISSVAFSHDGLKCISGSLDNTAKIWDVITGEEIMELSKVADINGHTDPITSCNFSVGDSGSLVVTCSDDTKIKIWDGNTGLYIKSIGYKTNVKSVCFSHDNKYILASGADNAATIFDIDTGSEVSSLKGHTNWISSSYYFENYKKIVTGGFDNLAKIWCATSMILILTLTGHSDVINSLSCSNDSRYILTGSQDRTAILWDSSTGDKIKLFKHDHSVVSVAFSPDGTLVMTSTGHGRVTVWDCDSCNEVIVLNCDDDHHLDSSVARSVSFSPDGKYVLTGSDDGTPRLWNIDLQIPSQTGELSHMTLIDIVEDSVGKYVYGENPEHYSLEGTIFERYPYLLHYPVAGITMMQRIVQREEIDAINAIKWCAIVSPRSLLTTQKYHHNNNVTTSTKLESHTVLEYNIREKNTSICKYFAKLYTELLLPSIATVRSQKILLENMAAQYSQGRPLCDLIEVQNLVLLAKIYPDLILQIVQKLSPVPTDKKRLVGVWLKPITRFEVKGSSEVLPLNNDEVIDNSTNYWITRLLTLFSCSSGENITTCSSPVKKSNKFWDHSSDNKLLLKNPMVFAVETAILPLRNVASMNHDFLGAVFCAAKGNPAPFESEFLEVLVDFKWRSHVREAFRYDFFLYIILAISYVAHAIWFIQYSILPYGDTERILGVMFFVFVTLLHSYFVLHEIKQVISVKENKIYKVIVNHLLDPWNLQDMIRLSMVSASLVYYFVLIIHSSNDGYVDPYGLRLVSTLSAVSIPMYALGFLFYLQAIKGYGALVRMVLKIIESTGTFLGVLVIMIFGYSASFNLMTVTDYSDNALLIDDRSWNTYANSLLSSTLLVMGVDVEITAITDTYYAPVAVTLLVSFTLLMCVIMLNLLIAIMSDKHGEVKEQERASATYNRASIVVEYEKLMSPSERLKPEYSPTYLQVLLPEKIIVNNDDGEEIKALQQLVHDKTDELKEELKEVRSQDAYLRNEVNELKIMISQLLAEAQANKCKNIS